MSPALLIVAAAAALSWLQEPEEVMGVGLGALHSESPIPECKRKSPPKCFQLIGSDPKFGVYERLEGHGLSFVTDVMVTSHANTIYMLSMSGPSDTYKDARATLIEKYGRPTKETHGTVRNGLGTEFPAEELEWRGTAVSLSLKERSGKISTWGATFSYLPKLAELSESSKSEVKAEASKL